MPGLPVYERVFIICIFDSEAVTSCLIRFVSPQSNNKNNANLWWSDRTPIKTIHLPREWTGKELKKCRKSCNFQNFKKLFLAQSDSTKWFQSHLTTNSCRQFVVQIKKNPWKNIIWPSPTIYLLVWNNPRQVDIKTNQSITWKSTHLFLKNSSNFLHSVFLPLK